MAHKHAYPIELTCPTCRTSYDIKLAVIPQRCTQVRCQECNQTFDVDVLNGHNSRLCGETLDQEHAFQVNKPCCEGFVYDAEGVERLMRDGVVDAFTEVRPLRSKKFVPARQLQELW